jgi:hypothetical protein
MSPLEFACSQPHIIEQPDTGGQWRDSRDHASLAQESQGSAGSEDRHNAVDATTI